MAPILLFTDPSAPTKDLHRIAAAAGVELSTVVTPEDAAGVWRSAPLIVMDTASARRAIAADLPHRPGLLVVSDDHEDPDVWRHAAHLGVEHVLFLPDAEVWLIDRLAEATDNAPAGRVVTVIGARGGAGATSFAVALALAAIRADRRAMLVDADPYGGGIDLALGADGVTPHWNSLGSDIDPPQAATASAPGELLVLAWPRTGPAEIPPDLETVVRHARRSKELVIIDLPRSFDPTARAALSRSDVTFIVCPAEVRACAAGRRIADTARLFCDDVRVVGRGPAPTDVTGPLVAETLGLPFAGWLDSEPGIDTALDEGRAPGSGGHGPLAELCDQLVVQLAPIAPTSDTLP